MLLQPYLYIGAKVLQKIEFHKSERKFFARLTSSAQRSPKSGRRRRCGFP